LNSQDSKVPARILLLNWRDPENPKAGGAERLTLEWAKAWQAAGAQVTLFANAFPGCADVSMIDGIRTVRRGNPVTQWHHARAFDRREGPFDLVVEEINTLPFLSCLWAAGRSVLLMHQLAREVWFFEAPWPVALLGYAAEPLYLRLYSRQPALVLSDSTRQDLIALGFRRDRVQIVPGATDAADSDSRTPEKLPTFIYVGRITPSKRVDHIIKAFEKVHAHLAAIGVSSRLRIVGRGQSRYVQRLHKLIKHMDLDGAVEFWGWRDRWWSDPQLSRSHALVMASVREGWGLVVTEANAIGIPAIGYAVAGLHDSIQDGKTGILTRRRTPAALAEAMLRLITSPGMRERLSAAARKDAAGRTWANSKDHAVDNLVLAVGHLHDSPRRLRESVRSRDNDGPGETIAQPATEER
jgi:glycosyltransferase involved in cell wall biosynthesis